MTTSGELPVVWVFQWGDGTWHMQPPCFFGTSVVRHSGRVCPLDDNGTTAEERRIKELEDACRAVARAYNGDGSIYEAAELCRAALAEIKKGTTNDDEQ